MTKELLDKFDKGISRLITELEQSRIKTKQLETEADGLRIHGADRDRLESQIEELKTTLETAELEIADKERKLSEKNQLLAEKETAREVATKAIATAGADRDAAMELAEESGKKVGELEWYLGERTSELDAIKAEMTALKARAAELESLAGNGPELEKAEARIVELEAQAAATAPELKKAVARVSELEAQAAATAPELKNAEARIAELEANAAATAPELQKAVARVAELETQVAVGADLQTRLDEALTRENTMKERLSGLLARIEEAESMLDSMEVAHHGQG